jgi:hypothetical protein
VSERKSFRLFRKGKEVRLAVLSELRWKVVSASKETGFRVGDEVTPPRVMSWFEARRRVNSGRSALSPNRLVLLRGTGFERSEEEIDRILRLRLWDPDAPLPAL